MIKDSEWCIGSTRLLKSLKHELFFMRRLQRTVQIVFFRGLRAQGIEGKVPRHSKLGSQMFTVTRDLVLENTLIGVTAVIIVVCLACLDDMDGFGPTVFGICM